MDASLAINVLAATVGAFFVLARFRFFYDPSKPKGTRWLNADRNASLTAKMAHCGLTRGPKFWAWVTSCVEVFGGLALITGVGRWVAAPAILFLLIIATKCTAKAKVCEQHPVDCVDVVCAYLWRVEGLYILMTALVVWYETGPVASRIVDSLLSF